MNKSLIVSKLRKNGITIKKVKGNILELDGDVSLILEGEPVNRIRIKVPRPAQNFGAYPIRQDGEFCYDRIKFDIAVEMRESRRLRTGIKTRPTKFTFNV